ncbi:2-O-methyltransferase NoeI [Novipirellula galeiformis]|uniref:2-O-methyltransferase NoeI n=1 Tax=Novipirellula galeiformis TaxID=2528004 RepID=A0A5C6CW21_9BACT|nr:2-O-methyltransferase NoeI [Novipirellula galeiformis]
MRRLITRPILSLLKTAGWELRKALPVGERRLLEYKKRMRDSWGCLKEYHPGTVLDIGANEGQFAGLIREFLPGAKIVSFEPLKSCFETLQSKQAELAPSLAFHTALGSEPGTATINRSAFTPSSSLLPMGSLHKVELPHTAESVQEEIVISRLDDILNDLELEEPILMKIDVQGFEEQVLLGAEQTLQKVIAVVVEVSAQPLYEGEPGFDRIYEIMKSHGFAYCGNVDQWRNKKSGHILQFDCLFENRNLRPQS